MPKEAPRPKGGRPPFGQRWSNGELAEHQQERMTLERMHQLRQWEDLTLHEIAARLDAEGRPTRDDKPWKAGSVHNILEATMWFPTPTECAIGRIVKRVTYEVWAYRERSRSGAPGWTWWATDDKTNGG